MNMSSESSFVLSVLSAVFAGVLGFLWWFFRDSMQRLEARTDKLGNHFGQFKAGWLGPIRR